ncbi:MAG: group III truncated hemoglobin [Burkholderiales bacterium]|mgnify:CR=1 FL=1|nr:group III truncated hemoglobin [Burkholderiales bacterium]ODU66932.1 MAG: preprotein translocase subunit TatC [Lautropia sp. SCN 66-9]
MISMCSEEEIRQMVDDFYAKVRRDEQLGPIFNSRIDDWDHHLVKLTDFWSSLLRGTTRFAGSPMTKHIALPGLSAALFQRWLQLFHETTQTLPNRMMAERADAMAQRIARSLWFGYQTSHRPDVLAEELDLR